MTPAPFDASQASASREPALGRKSTALVMLRAACGVVVGVMLASASGGASAATTGSAVTPGGTYRTSVAIPAPPAPGAPTVSLQYDSAAGLGIAGVGWDLSVGWPTLIARDTRFGTPAWSYDSAWVWGDAPLVTRASCSGPGTCYRAAPDSLADVRIDVRSASPFASATLPNGAVLTYKPIRYDGVSYPAAPAGAQTNVFGFLLKQAKSPNGYLTCFVHTHHANNVAAGRVPVLSAIWYGPALKDCDSRPADRLLHRIAYEYVDPTAPSEGYFTPFSYRFGAPVSFNNLLRRIIVYAAGDSAQVEQGSYLLRHEPAVDVETRVETRLPRLTHVTQVTAAAGPLAKAQPETRLVRHFSYGTRKASFGDARILDVGADAHAFPSSLSGSETRPIRIVNDPSDVFGGGWDQPNVKAPKSVVVRGQWGLLDVTGDGLLDTVVGDERGPDAAEPSLCPANGQPPPGKAWATFEKCADPGARPPQQWVFVNEGVKDGKLGSSKVLLETSAGALETDRSPASWIWLEGQGKTRAGMPTAVSSSEIRGSRGCATTNPTADTRRWPYLPDGSVGGSDGSIGDLLPQAVAPSFEFNAFDLALVAIKAVADAYIPRDSVSSSLSGWVDWDRDGVPDWVVSPGMLFRYGQPACVPIFSDPLTNLTDLRWHVAKGTANLEARAGGRVALAATPAAGPAGPVPLPLSFSINAGQAEEWGLKIPLGTILTGAAATAFSGFDADVAAENLAQVLGEAFAPSAQAGGSASLAYSSPSVSATSKLLELAVTRGDANPTELARAGGSFLSSTFKVGLDLTLKDGGSRVRNQSRAELADVNADGAPDYLLYDSAGLLGKPDAGAVLVYLNDGNGGFRPPQRINAGHDYTSMPPVADIESKAKAARFLADVASFFESPCLTALLMPAVELISAAVKFGAMLVSCGGLLLTSGLSGARTLEAVSDAAQFLQNSTDALPGDRLHVQEARLLAAGIAVGGVLGSSRRAKNAAEAARLVAHVTKQLAYPSRLNAFSKGVSITKGNWWGKTSCTHPDPNKCIGGISAQTVGQLDLNGDALPDQVITRDREKRCSGDDEWAVYWGTGTASLSQKRAFVASPTCIPVPASPEPVKAAGFPTIPLQADFSVVPETGATPTETRTYGFITLVDHNHDGRPDLVVVEGDKFEPYAASRTWRVYLNHGQGFDLQHPLTIASVQGSPTGVVRAPAHGPAPSLAVAYPGLKSSVTWGQSAPSSTGVDAGFIDVDGDGTADLAQRVRYDKHHVNGQERWRAGIMYWSRAGAAPQDLLIEERDPIAGSRTRISYAPASHFQWPDGVPTGQRPPGGHRAGMGSPAYLVKSMTSEPFIGRAERRTSTAYDYKDPHFARESRTSTGFGRVSQRPLDPQTGQPIASATSTVTYSSQGEHHRGGPTLTRIVDESTGAPVSETFTSYAEKAIATAGPTTMESHFSAPADTIGVEFPHDLVKPALLDVGFDGRRPLGNRADRDTADPATSGDTSPANALRYDAELPTGGGAVFGGPRWVSFPSPHTQSAQPGGTIGQVTIEAWLRPGSGSGRGTVARLGNAYELTLEPSGAVAFAVNAGGWTRMNGPQLPILRWSHVAASHDGSKLRIFVDGALKAELTASGALPAAGKLEVGCSYDALTQLRVACYEGAIGELRIYPEAWRAPARITRSRTEYSLNQFDSSFGFPVASWNYGDLSHGDDDVHEQISYAVPQAGGHVRDAIATKTRRELLDDGTLDGYLGYSETRYDGLAVGAVAAGNPTSSSVYSGAVPTHQTPTGDTTTKTRYTDPACPGVATATEDPEGAVTKTQYDATCALALAATNALGHTTKREYYGVNGVAYSDPNSKLAGLYGQPKAASDANGATTRTGYDEWGRPTASFGPLHSGDKPEVSTSYRDAACVDGSGSTASCVDADARLAEPPATTVKTWDETHRSYRVVHRFADGQVQTEAVKQGAPDWIVSGTADFDALGRQTRAFKQRYLPAACTAGSSCDPKYIKSGSRHVQTAYDQRGRVVRAYGPDVPICPDLTAAACDAVARQANGKFTQFEYPAPGVTRTLDARGVPTVVRRDIRGLTKAAEEFTKASNSPYAVASYAHNRDGRVITVTDLPGNTISTTYDALGRKTATTDPDLGSWKYTYDKLGRLLEQRDARGAVMKHDYDPLGRVTRTELHTPPRVTPNYRTYSFDGGAADSDVSAPVAVSSLWHKGAQVENQKELLSVPHRWEAVALTPLLPLAAGNTDNGVAQLSLPFDFALTPHQQWRSSTTCEFCIAADGTNLFPSGTPLYVSTNGKIRFNASGPGGPPPVDNGIPYAQLPVKNGEIAVYALFNDLVMTRGMWHGIAGSAPDRRFIVEWDGEFKSAPGVPAQFRAIFHETTYEVELQYAKLPPAPFGRGGSTVGLQNHSSTSPYAVAAEWRAALASETGLSSRRTHGNTTLAFNNGTTYGIGQHVSGRATFEIDLRDATSATLSFRHSWNTRCAAYASGACPVDRMRVIAAAYPSVGCACTTLLDTAQLTAEGFNAGTSSLPTAPLLSAELPKWAMGERVRIEFEFDSVDATKEPRYGWLLDDIRVSKSFEAVEEVVTREYDSAELASDLSSSKPVLDLTFDVPSRIEDRSPTRATVNPVGIEPTQGASGKGIHLDGTKSYLSAKTDQMQPLAYALSAEAWVKPVSPGGGGAIARRSDTFGLERDKGKLRCWVRAGGAIVEAHGATVLPADVWMHVAMTYDGTTVRCYVNGAEDGSASVPAPPAPFDATAHPIVVGHSIQRGYLAGSLDEVRVFANALAASDVLDHARSALQPGPPRGNVLDLRFADPAKPELDSSGAGSDATAPVSAGQGPGVQGNALDLTTPGSHVRVKTSPSLQSDVLTAEAWTKTTSSQHRLLVGKWDPKPGPGWRLALNGGSGRVRFEVRTVPSTPDSWAHWTGDTTGRPPLGGQSCGPTSSAPAARRKWTAPLDGKVTFSTVDGASWDTVLVVEEGGIVVGCGDDDAGTKQSSVTLDVTANKTYDVHVTGGSTTSTGPFTVLVSRPQLTPAAMEFVTVESVNDGKWHHVAGTYDGRSLKVYIDGKRALRWCGGEEAAGPTTCRTDEPPTECSDEKVTVGDGSEEQTFGNGVCANGSVANFHPLMVGAYVPGGDSLDGMLDEVRVSNYAKRDWEVAASARLASAYTHALGREVAMRGRWASSMPRYDLLGRVVSEQKSVPLLQPAAAKVIRAAYDNVGRASSRRYPDGEVTVSDFDFAGTETQLTGYGDFFAHPAYGKQPYLDRVDLGPTGRLEHVKYGNGVTSTFWYDDTPNPTGSFNEFLKAQITSSGATTLQDQELQYDGVGNLTYRRDLATESTYTYDDLSRLKTFETKRSGNVAASGSYDYDTLGNLMTKEGATLSYSGGSNCGIQLPQALPHAVRSVTGGGATTEYCYDANGSVAEIRGPGVTKLRHDARGKLHSFEGPSGTFQFDYDGNGQRIHKTGPAGRTTEVFPFFRITPKGVEKYYFAGGRRIARRAGVKAEDLSWYHPDHLGGTNVMSGADGAELANGHSEYTPFGGAQPGAANQTAPVRSGGYQFTGKELDETGLYDFGARYYDPAIGRFIEADTVLPNELPQALNRYSYVYNNPVRYVDPTGHEPWKIEQYRADIENSHIRGLSPQRKAQLAAEDRAEIRAHEQDSAALHERAIFHIAEYLGFNGWARAYTGENVHGQEVENRFEEAVVGTHQIALNTLTTYSMVKAPLSQLGRNAGAGAPAGPGPWYADELLGTRKVTPLEHAQQYAAEVRALTPVRKPTMVSVTVDPATGNVLSFGRSGKVPGEIHPVLSNRMPNPSLERYPPGNCAEFNACNTALLNGSKLEHLDYVTVRTRTAAPEPPCGNCRAILEGANYVGPR